MERDVRALIEVMESGIAHSNEYGEIGFSTDIFEYLAEIFQTEEGAKELAETLNSKGLQTDISSAISATVGVLGALYNLKARE